jgi:hypothetical protein
MKPSFHSRTLAEQVAENTRAIILEPEKIELFPLNRRIPAAWRARLAATERYFYFFFR